MDRRRDEYVAAGVRLIWFVDPDSRTVAVESRDGVPRVADAGDTLDGGDVLPGFTLAVDEVFAELDRSGD